MSTPTTVRRLTPQDRAAWEPLWEGYQHFYREAIPPEVTETTFARLCDGTGAMVGLVAETRAGELLGIAHLVFHPATWSSADYCYLEDLYVDPSARGGEVSQQLFAAIDAEATARGSERIYWHTQQYNGRARSLYDTVGVLTSFVVYEREPR